VDTKQTLASVARNVAMAALGAVFSDGPAAPQPGEGHKRARARLTAKLKANATLYADVPEAPASRQVLRRVARRLAKQQATAARLQAIKGRRTKAATPQPAVIAEDDVRTMKRAVRETARRAQRAA